MGEIESAVEGGGDEGRREMEGRGEGKETER